MILSCRILFRFFLIFLLIANSIAFAQSSNLDLSPKERPQVRSRILNCETLLIPSDQIDDSVGIPFSTNSVEDFQQQVTQAVAQYGLEKFRDGTFYVMGIAMPDSFSTQQRYLSALSKLNLTSVGAKVVILSVPSNLIKDDSVGLARHALQRLRYFLPSATRDYQPPQWGEILSNWQATAVVEGVNVFCLFKTLPISDASLVVATHAVILTAFTVFTKSILNYLFRNGSRDERFNHVELFLKQTLLSLPWVLNYAVFGHFSEILQFYAVHGWQDTLARFPYEIEHFGTTQGVTLVLQTLFYSTIITEKFGGWVDSQIGDRNTRDARTLRPWLQVPVIATDAVLLMLASNDWHPLLQFGAFDINTGHAGLLAMTLGLGWIFKKCPQVLQPFLRRYQYWRQSRDR